MTSREANDNDPRMPGDPGTPASQSADKRPADLVGDKVLGREPVVLPKRFYTSVATSSVERGGHAVLLDGRPIKTPKKSQVIVPTRKMAEALAAEWQAQGERIDPSTMPITRLVNTTLDAVTPNLSAVRADLVDFAGSDALCYRAGEPAALAERQALIWDPILDWADKTLGAKFVTQVGVIHKPQPTTTIAAIARAVDTYSAWEIAPLHVMTTITGSVVLALAVKHGAIDLDAAWAAAHVDEDWQISTWGDDDEAQHRRNRRWLEIQASTKMLETLR